MTVNHGHDPGKGGPGGQLWGGSNPKTMANYGQIMEMDGINQLIHAGQLNN